MCKAISRWELDRIEAAMDSAALFEAQHKAGQLERDVPEKPKRSFAEQLELLKQGKARLVSNVIPKAQHNYTIAGVSSFK